MIDLSTVKSIEIPEGKVTSIRRNGTLIWTNPWDYLWSREEGFPDSAVWACPIGSGSAVMETDGLRLTAGGSAYAGLRYIDVANCMSKKAILEIVCSVQAASGNGIRFVLGAGENGSPLGYGVQATVNGGYLNIMAGSDALTNLSKTAVFEYNKLHTLTMKLDADADKNEIYLDDVLVATQTTGQLSTTYVGSVWCLAQAGDVLLQSFKYRRLDR